MKLSYFIIFTTLMMSNSAFAGKVGGNGGFVCVNKKTQKIITLDQSDASFVFDFKEDLGAVTIDYRKKVEMVIERLSKLDLFRAHRYSAYFKTAFMLEENFLVAPDELDFVENKPDIESFPLVCDELVQAASQILGKDGYVTYKVRSDIWTKMDNNAKASLVLHEIVYTEALSRNHPGSLKTRYFTGLICSEEFKTMSRNKYFYFMRMIGMGTGSAMPVGVRPPVENGF